MTTPFVRASLAVMANEPTVAELQQRIAELEQQVADLQTRLNEATGHHHAEPGEDTQWGEFNPG